MEINKAFGKQSPDIVDKLSSFITLFGVDADELFAKWEAFRYSRAKETGSNDDVGLNSENLTLFSSYVAKTIEKKSRQSATSSVKKTKRLTSSPGMFDFLPSTPSGKRKLGPPSSERSLKRPSMLSSSPTKGYSDPESSEISELEVKQEPETVGLVAKLTAEVKSTLNPEISDDKSIELGASTASLATNFDAEKYKFRTMRQNLLEAADVLDDQIDSYTSYLIEKYPEYVDLVSNPNMISQSDIIAVGRITPDSALATLDEPLNKESLCLEPSRTVGIGQRIKLNLSSLKDYSFFPGQIVAFKGRNANGKFFTPTEIVAPDILGACTSTKSEIEAYDAALNGHNLKIVVTSGPYTTNDEIKFDILAQLVNQINQEIKPQVVIMFGPFLDYSHPKIIDGSIEDVLQNTPGARAKTLDEVFKLVVAPVLNQIDIKIKVILIPSTRDISSRHPSYPQDSLDRRTLGLSKNFVCFPNPASFQINECQFGVSNNDIFKDLKDLVVGNVSENRFDRITNYILDQRRYYPQFPGSVNHQKIKLISPPPESADFKISEIEEKITNPRTVDIQPISGSDLNIPYLGLTEFTDTTPDVLVIPSNMKSFARVVKNVLVVNPGSLMKAKKGGSYAIINVKSAIENGEVQLTKVEEDLYLNDIWKRCRVDIVSCDLA